MIEKTLLDFGEIALKNERNEASTS